MGGDMTVYTHRVNPITPYIPTSALRSHLLSPDFLSLSVIPQRLSHFLFEDKFLTPLHDLYIFSRQDATTKVKCFSGASRILRTTYYATAASIKTPTTKQYP